MAGIRPAFFFVREPRVFFVTDFSPVIPDVPLEQATLDAFSASGWLAEATQQFHERSGQQAMAQAVARAIVSRHPLVVEAGTGTGKTFSYLVPTLLSGQRALISTATKTLQDQLYGRDLPMLVQAMGLPTRLALLKGRASYLCLHRMELARHDDALSDAFMQRALARVERWARTTRRGDLAEIEGLDERSPIIPLVTSTRENCLGSDCEHYKACHVNLARREAMAADIVVINHHLFFADMAVRESGVAELLPSVSVAVFDEAHQLNETGVQFLGVQLGTRQLLDLAHDTLAAGLQRARGLVDWQAVAAGLDRAARELRLAVGKQYPDAKLRWLDATPEGVSPADWARAVDGVEAACDQAVEALAAVEEMAPDFAKLLERAQQMLAHCAHFRTAPKPEYVRWVEVGSQALRLKEAPLDIADTVRRRMLGASPAGAAADTPSGRAAPSAHEEPPPWDDDEGPPWGDDEAALLAGAPGDEASAEPSAQPCALIFTSATLGADTRLRWFTEPCGLESADILQVDSPFDYARQAAIYVPRHLPKPGDPSHSAAIAHVAAEGARRLGGRTLVLTTTLRALRAIGDVLAQALGEQLDILVQGQASKRALIERFRTGDSHGQRGCVLVASTSFWEGVDVPGDALQLVVIDKLPFPPPNDPLVEARSRRLEAQGRSSFADYSLPEAAVALKQGAGRLIRRETDRGILVIGDTRLTTMGYGRRLLAALPPMRVLQTPAEYEQALLALQAGHAAGDENDAPSAGFESASTF
ncbi:MAG: putative ATP-dependent helicase DinG [Paracidovorax wautersii]|uniref:Putative ATP-dependent helicase DinG n=1 Tax=Paracidovorax wautersii TaxID=1177982 RepID=A0A7V8FQW1_9BURK|nr:MAG: putative ATP-dependent helicase DinG [Paracidovorax wautersii]